MDQDSEQAAEIALKRGGNVLDLAEGAVHYLSGEARSLARVDQALDRVVQASPRVKRNILLACAHTVAADGLILYREAALIRAIADVLDCPTTPFAGALESQQHLEHIRAAG